VEAAVDSAVAESDFEAVGECLEVVEEVLRQRSYMGRIRSHPLLRDSVPVEKLEEAEGQLVEYPQRLVSTAAEVAEGGHHVATTAAEVVHRVVLSGIEPTRSRLLLCYHRSLVLWHEILMRLCVSHQMQYLYHSHPHSQSLPRCDQSFSKYCP
jgi:hypothetical protein